jgi:hypothetical protein
LSGLAARILAVAVAAALAATGATAAAFEYEVPIRIESEEDLYELLATQQISEDTFHTLIELYRRGVDLNEATRDELYTLPNLTLLQVDRILAYRKQVGFIRDPADLVATGILASDDLYGIAPFLVVGATRRAPNATDGFVRYPTLWTAEDPRFPATALQARVRTYRHLTVGGATVLTQSRLGDVVYDPNRDALVAEAPSAQVHVPKLFLQWDTEDWGAIVGSYRIGFGQRLTFDTTDRYTPNGFVLDDAVLRSVDLVRECSESQGELAAPPCPEGLVEYVTPDFRWRDAQRGAAVGLKRLPVEYGWFQAYGFASYQEKSIYQYELYDRRRCSDPTDDDDPACGAPSVYRYQDDPLAPTSKFSFETLPDMFAELTLGGNVSFFQSRRNHLGVTGYGSTVRWLTEGIDLDFQEWSRWPRGGAWGAVGLDAAVGRRWADVGFELVRSFDSMGGAGGGFGAVARSTATWEKNELELVLRWYGLDFVNPYAGAVAAADETDGQRVRDERGARLRYTALLKRRLSLRTLIDLWEQPSEDQPKLTTYLRADYKLTTRMDAGVWTSFADKDLSRGGGAMECYEVSVEEDEAGEPIPCSGRKYQVAGRFRIAPLARLSLSLQYQHSWLDDPRYDDRLRQDLSAWFVAAARLGERVSLRGRLRYLSEDISDGAYLEESLWGYVDVVYREPRSWIFRLRYDTYVWLDDRESTRERTPSPEHRLLAEIEARF